MASIWVESLGRNFEQALDLLHEAMRDCTAELWEPSIWEVPVRDTDCQLVGRDGRFVTDPAELRALIQRWSTP